MKFAVVTENDDSALDTAIQWNMSMFRLTPFPTPNESRSAPIEPLVSHSTVVSLDVFKAAIVIMNATAADYRKIRVDTAARVLTLAMAHGWMARSRETVPLSIPRATAVILTEQGCGLYPSELIDFIQARAKEANPFNWSLVIPLVIPGNVVLFGPPITPRSSGAWDEELELLWLRTVLSTYSNQGQLHLELTELCGEVIRSAYRAADTVKQYGQSLKPLADLFKKTIPVQLAYAREGWGDPQHVEDTCNDYVEWLSAY